MIDVVVPGRAVPAGRLTIGRRRDGTTYLRHGEGTRLNAWKRAIRREVGHRKLYTVAVRVDLVFHVDRPKAHYLARGLRADAPAYPTGRATADLDKLTRAVLDALTGSAYTDDSQVAELVARKRYCPPGHARLELRVRDLGDDLDQLHLETITTTAA